VPNDTNFDALMRAADREAAAAVTPALTRRRQARLDDVAAEVVDVDTVIDLVHAKIELIKEFKLDIDGEYYRRAEPETYLALTNQVTELERLAKSLEATRDPEVGTGADTKYTPLPRAECASIIGEGLHTGLRKGSDDPQTPDLWSAIHDAGQAWSDALAYVVWGLDHMGLARCRKETSQ